MIQFNLLPDIKVAYIKSQRTKRLVMLISVIAIGVSAALLVFTFSFRVVQNQRLSSLNKDIAGLRAELESNTELSKILSVQNQLNALPALYDGRPAVERLPEYLDQLTPSGVSINNLVIDFSLATLEISGGGENISAINAYVDTLKFTTFAPGDGTDGLPAFMNTVLASFGRGDNGVVSFTINANFSPQIFDATQDVELTVPNIVTTRAQSVQTDLFEVPSSEEGGQ